MRQSASLRSSGGMLPSCAAIMPSVETIAWPSTWISVPGIMALT
jgi:hypothetical protein